MPCDLRLTSRRPMSRGATDTRTQPLQRRMRMRLFPGCSFGGPTLDAESARKKVFVIAISSLSCCCWPTDGDRVLRHCRPHGQVAESILGDAQRHKSDNRPALPRTLAPATSYCSIRPALSFSPKRDLRKPLSARTPSHLPVKTPRAFL